VCSATSMESSHRDLLNDMAEQTPTLKNNPITHYSHIFQDRPIYGQPHQWKALAESFWMIWFNVDLSQKITKTCTTSAFVSHPKQVYRSPSNRRSVFTANVVDEAEEYDLIARLKCKLFLCVFSGSQLLEIISEEGEPICVSHSFRFVIAFRVSACVCWRWQLLAAWGPSSLDPSLASSEHKTYGSRVVLPDSRPLLFFLFFFTNVREEIFTEADTAFFLWSSVVGLVLYPKTQHWKSP